MLEVTAARRWLCCFYGLGMRRASRQARCVALAEHGAIATPEHARPRAVYCTIGEMEDHAGEAPENK